MYPIKTMSWLVLASAVLLSKSVTSGYKSIYKYDAWIESIEFISPMNGRFFKWDKNTRPSKFNKTVTVFNALFEMKLPFDDELIVFVKVYKYQGNEFRHLIDQEFAELCTKLTAEKEIASLFQSMTSFPLDGPCPIPPGTYDMQNFAFYGHNLPFEIPPKTDKVKANIIYYTKDKSEVLSDISWVINLNQRKLETPTLGR